MVRYDWQMHQDYGLKRKEFEQIIATAKTHAWMSYDHDTGECDATGLAENTAHALNHDEWLDEQTHPLWDIAADVAMNYEAEPDEDETPEEYDMRRHTERVRHIGGSWDD